MLRRGGRSCARRWPCADVTAPVRTASLRTWLPLGPALRTTIHDPLAGIRRRRGRVGYTTTFHRDRPPDTRSVHQAQGRRDADRAIGRAHDVLGGGVVVAKARHHAFAVEREVDLAVLEGDPQPDLLAEGDIDAAHHVEAVDRRGAIARG